MFYFSRIIAIGTCLAALSGCVRHARPAVGADEPALRADDIDRSWLRPDAVGSVRLVPLLAGERPLRGSVVWYGNGGGGPGSARCADEGSLWYCAADRWLVGENRDGRGIASPSDAADRILIGSDLGFSVRFGSPERMIVYLGDSIGVPATGGCGAARPLALCNDAILVVDPTDADAEDGVSASAVAVEGPGGSTAGFLPLIVPGVNGEGALPRCPKVVGQAGDPPCLGPFNVPTGAATVRMPSSLLPGAASDAGGDTEAVLLFYATAARRPEMASWITASTDGYRFAKLRDGPFSRDRFVSVAPVPVSAAEIEEICRDAPASPLCDPELGLAGGDAVLLFGTGEKYREGRLYLGALRLADLAVRYYRLDPSSGRETWVADERGATPIIEDANRAAAQFGELSVARVDAAECPEADRGRCADTLVLLASQRGFVRYRTARLAFPGARGEEEGRRGWSESRRTGGRGYAPGAFDAFTRVARGPGGGLELVLYHTLSAWNGRGPGEPERTPYGVFTRRLMLIDEASCRKSDDRELLCDELPPPWPPEP
jgi:hypothetical protein